MFWLNCKWEQHKQRLILNGKNPLRHCEVIAVNCEQFNVCVCVCVFFLCVCVLKKDVVVVVVAQSGAQQISLCASSTTSHFNNYYSYFSSTVYQNLVLLYYKHTHTFFSDFACKLLRSNRLQMSSL